MSEALDTHSAEQEADQGRGRMDLNREVGRAAAMMGRGDATALTTGDLAELRRISSDHVFTPALWKLLFELGLEDSPSWISQTEWERRWAYLLAAMAISAGLHEYQVPFGRALATAGWSELRFARLMRVRGERLGDHLRLVSRYLASKSQHANWADAARLIFHQSGDSSEAVRIRVSRAYYATLYAAEKKHS